MASLNVSLAYVSKKYWNTEYGLGYIFIKKGQQLYMKTEF